MKYYHYISMPLKLFYPIKRAGAAVAKLRAKAPQGRRTTVPPGR
jgi:hypothetical protein